MPGFQQELKGRYAVLGIVVVAVLGLLLAKLWTMQVLNGAQYADAAVQNRVRPVTTSAARGRIMDRNGQLLVSNRATMAVYVDPSAQHVVIASKTTTNTPLINRLSTVLGMPAADVQKRMFDPKQEALASRMVALDVPQPAVAYISEHPDLFAGVEVRAEATRQYPQGTLAAHVLGYTGQVSQDQLANTTVNGYQYGDIVGKAGAEAEFEKVLQGDRGQRLVEVDAQGKPQHIIQDTPPVQGHDVKLTIDSKVQKVTEQALQQALLDAHKAKFPHAAAGAAVAVDIHTGEIIAMASVPTYDPSLFLGSISDKQWKSLTATDSNYPLTNRAIAGQYPAASTFKAMTGLSALQAGLITPSTTVDCTGRWTEMGKQWAKWCWDHAGHGPEEFYGAVRDSCDFYFYHVGYLLYKSGGEKLQKFARKFGFGQDSGIDLPGEANGRVPDIAWKNAYFQNYPEMQGWNVGDTVNMAIGQGDLLVTPLQLADAYAGIANGGKVMRPHILKQVLGADGKPVLTYQPTVAFDSGTSASNLATMRSALLAVTTTGTGKGAFSGFPVPVAGKTGTAQVSGKDDYAWFVGFAPANHPKYAVAVMIEQGGHGGSVAGPAARQIFAALLGQKIQHVSATDTSR
ncbi:MAG: penicillin-binding protein 2 [Coriobacteriia bacterium]|nr:penicillin-binding protein 2 [Coriobacteriia bacterium]